MSASSSRSTSPVQQHRQAQSNLISQFLRRQDDTPLFYSTLEERHPVNATMEASEDSNHHGLGREQLGSSLGLVHEETFPFRLTSPTRIAEARRNSAALLEDSLYSRSENSVLPQMEQPSSVRQTGWRMHQPSLRPESSMSNKASDLDSHFVGQSVMLSPPSSHQSPASAPSRSPSDDLLSALSGAQESSSHPPSKPDEVDEPHPTLYLEHSDQPPSHLRPQDSGWLAVYLTCCTITLGIAIYAYFFANLPYDLPATSGALPDDAEVEEAAALLSILPLLTSLTLLSILGAVSAIGYMMLVQRGVRRMVYGLLIGGPTGLVMLSFWAWGFSWSEEEEQGTEARWVCLGASILAGICVSMIWKRRSQIEKTVQVIELAVSSLLAHPAIFGLQLAVLLAHLILTIPFFSLFSRLLLLHPTNSTSHTLILTFHVLFTYLWSMSIFRGLLKLTIARTISHWFFSRHEPNPEHATSTALVMASFDAARGPQLGTVAFSSLLVTVADLAAFIMIRLKRWTRPANGLLPNWAACLYLTAPLVALLASFVENISSYALIWSGITGEGFWQSTRRVTGLVRGNGMSKTADYLLVKLLLSLLTLTFSFLAGILGILFARSFSSAMPEHHLHHFFATLLCFLVPYYTVRLCSDLLSNAVDTIFVCFNLDLDSGQNHCTSARAAFLSKEESPV